jgi:hypothetical protein
MIPPPMAYTFKSENNRRTDRWEESEKKGRKKGGMVKGRE